MPVATDWATETPPRPLPVPPAAPRSLPWQALSGFKGEKANRCSLLDEDLARGSFYERSFPDWLVGQISWPLMASFRYEGQRLAYTIHGDGTKTTLLMPGLLLSQQMQTPLAPQLAKRGNRVVTFDPLGHGASDRPRDMWRYSMPAFAAQTVALLDHLELDQAVVGGTSLGANITLEVAASAPARLRGMIIEMPVLDNAIPACAAAFTPLLFALTFGAPVMRLLARGAQLVPRDRVPF